MAYNRVETPAALSGDEKEQLTQIYSYLCRLSDDLNINLEAIGGNELTDSERVIMNKIINPQEDVPTSQVVKELKEMETLKSLIIKTASFVQTSVQEYRTTLLRETVAEGQFGRYVRNTGLDVDVNPEGITQNYTFEEVVQGLKTYSINAKNYIKTGLLRTVNNLPIYGVAIGKDVVTFSVDGEEHYNDGNKVAELTADELSFYQNGSKLASYKGSRIGFYYNGTEVFYISNGKIYAAGDMLISSGGSLKIKSGATFSLDSGNLSVDSSGNVTFKGGAEILSGEALTIKSGANLDVNSGGNMNIKSGGALTIKSGGDLAIKSGGTVSIDSGNFAIDSNGNVTLKGGAEILSGKALTVKSGGDLNIKSGGTITVAGGNFSIDASGNATFKGGGTFSGNLSAAGGTFTGNLSAAGGTFTGSMETGNWLFDNKGARYKNDTTGSNFQVRLFDDLTASAKGAVAFGTTPNSSEGESGSSISGISLMATAPGGTKGYICLESQDVYSTYGIAHKPITTYPAATSQTGEQLNNTSVEWTVEGIFEAKCITANCGTVVYDTLVQRSSLEVKKKIREIEAAEDVIDELQPVQFTYRDDPQERTHYGLIYEDAFRILPEICTQDEGKKAIKYTELVPILIREIQELRKRVSRLEKERKG